MTSNNAIATLAFEIATTPLEPQVVRERLNELLPSLDDETMASLLKLLTQKDWSQTVSTWLLHGHRGEWG